MGNNNLSTPVRNDGPHNTNHNLQAQDDIVVITSPIIARQKNKLPHISDASVGIEHHIAAAMSPAKQRTVRLKRTKSSTQGHTVTKRSSIKDLISQAKSQTQHDEINPSIDQSQSNAPSGFQNEEMVEENEKV